MPKSTYWNLKKNNDWWHFYWYLLQWNDDNNHENISAICQLSNFNRANLFCFQLGKLAIKTAADGALSGPYDGRYVQPGLSSLGAYEQRNVWFLDTMLNFSFKWVLWTVNRLVPQLGVFWMAGDVWNRGLEGCTSMYLPLYQVSAPTPVSGKCPPNHPPPSYVVHLSRTNAH